MKEGIWLEPALALLQRKTKEERTDKHRHVARKVIVEGAGCRKDFSTKVGQMKANAKFVAKRKVRNITDSTIVQAGMKPGAIFQRPAGSGNNKQERRESGSPRSSKVGPFQQKGLKGMSPRMVGHGRKVESMWLVSGAIGL